MPELNWDDLQQLFSNAVTGGWSGVVSLLLTLIAVISVYFRIEGGVKKIAHGVSRTRRNREIAKNAVENEESEDRHADAEAEIEAMIEEEEKD